MIRLQTRSLHVVSLAAVIALTIGCAAPESEDADTSGDAISHEEAAKQRNLEQVVLKDAPASVKSQEELGIVRWFVYVNVDDEAADTVAFATDKENDVRFALVVQADKRVAAILEYDKAGLKADQDPSKISPETFQTLFADFASLQAKLLRMAQGTGDVKPSALSQGAECGLRLAAGALGSVVAMGLGAWAGAASLGAGVSALFTGLVGAGTVMSAAILHKDGKYNPIGLVNLGVVGRGASIVMDEAIKTVKVCDAAIRGR